MAKSPFSGLKKGALRKQLGVPKGKKIPEGVLEGIAEGALGNHIRYHNKSFKITKKLKQRGVLANNMREFREDDD